MSQDTDKEVLLGALLWLRNHYDVGKRSYKKMVLKKIDKILNANGISCVHLAAFDKLRTPKRRKKS